MSAPSPSRGSTRHGSTAVVRTRRGATAPGHALETEGAGGCHDDPGEAVSPNAVGAVALAPRDESDDSPRAAPREALGDTIVQFFSRAARMLMHGLTSRQARERWSEFAPEHAPACPPNHSTRIAGLAARGRLLVVGESGGQLVYVSADAPAEARRPGARDEEIVYAAVVEAMRRAAPAEGGHGGPSFRRDDSAGVAVTTLEVRSALPETAPAHLRSSGSSRLFRTLLRLSGLAGARPADVPAIRAQQREAALGHSVHLWSTELRAASESNGLTFRQAVIATVEAARAELGCPPTRYDWRLFVEANGSAGSATSAAAGIAAAARLVAPRATYAGLRVAIGHLDRKSARGRQGLADRGLSPLRTPYTVAGGAAVRYANSEDAPVTVDEERVCAALDAFELFAPADELDSLKQAETWATRTAGSHGPAADRFREALGALFSARRAALAGALVEAVPAEEWPRTLDAVRRVLDTRERWFAVIAKTKVRASRPAREFAEMVARPKRSAQALATWIAARGLESAGCMPGGVPVGTEVVARHQRRPARVAEAARADFSQLLEIRGGDRNPNHPVARTSRSLPPHGGALGGRWDAGPVAVAGDGPPVREAPDRDRVDAWAVAYRTLRRPVAQSLIARAVGLLGYVLRDAAVVDDVLRRLPPTARPTRRALEIASALIGRPNASKDAVDRLLGELATCVENEDEVAAVLALVLATPEGAPRALATAVRTLAPGRGRQVALAALATAQGRDVRLIVA